MGLDKHRSKSIVPVSGVDAVPSGAVGVRIRRRWALRHRLGGREDALIRRSSIAHRAVPVRSQLADLELDIIERGLHPRAPIVERLGDELEAVDSSVVAMVGVQQALLHLGVALGEELGELVEDALLNAVEDDLGFGIHGDGEWIWVVGGEGREGQEREFDTILLG